MPVLTRKKRITLVLLAVAAFLWIAQSAHRNLQEQQQHERHELSPLLAGMPMASGLTFETLAAGGKAVALNDFKGKVVLINFWASWCAPCMHEMPSLYAIQKRYADRGLAVLGMNMDDNPAMALSLLHKLIGDSPFPMFKGTNAAISERFMIEGLPFTVMIDKNFKIIYARAGEVDWAGPRAKELIEAQL